MSFEDILEFESSGYDDNDYADLFGNEETQDNTDNTDENDDTAEEQDDNVDPAKNSNKTKTQEKGAADNSKKETPAKNEKLEDKSNEDEEESEDYSFSIEGINKLLLEEGLFVLPEDFELENSVEGLEKAIELTKQNMKYAGAKAFYDDLPEDFKIVVRYALEGGTDVEEVLNHIKGVSEFDPDKIDIEDDAHLRRAAYQFFKETTKFSEQRIQRAIQQLGVS